MKIAIPLINEMISEYFRKANQFKIYEIKRSKIISTKYINTNGLSYINVCKILHLEKVELVLGAKISKSVSNILDMLNMITITGAMGNPDEVINNLIRNKNALREDYENNLDKDSSRCDTCH